MAEYLVLDTELTATAAAIRAKTGDSAAIEWVSGAGFATSVGDIPSGADLSTLEVYVADFLADPPTVTEGALDSYHRVIVS